MSPLTIPLLMASAALADPIEVHRTALEVVEQVAPQVPEGADGEAVRCRATVVIDGEGATRVEAVEDCSEAWSAAVGAALAQWRWKPWLVDGLAVEARTVLPVVWDPAPVLAPPPPPEQPEPVPVGGVVGGVVDEFRVMHHTELVVKRQVQPKYPADAAASDGNARCFAEVRIGTDGAPLAVEVTRCPDVFHEPTRAAMMRWRWQPPRVDGKAVNAKVVIVVNFERG